jgi:acyl-CoA synthetase (AMP-forming)/AMP-acid ligase II
VFVLENAQVEGDSRRAAGWLRAHGVRPGDRIAIVAENRPEYVPLATGALRSGIVPVPVNVHLADAERERIVSDAQVALVVDDDSWPDWSSGAPTELADVPLGRPMHYTSGTTGLAKGVWAGVLSEHDARALVVDEADLWGARPGDTYLVCSPLYHSAPLRVCTSALLAGARVVVFEQFDASEVARTFVDEHISGAFLVPTHLRRLLALDDFTAPHARRIVHAGEPCPSTLKRRAIDVFGVDNLLEFYGSTEGQFTMCTSTEWLAHQGSVGRARAGRKLRIDEPDAHGIGTIWVSAPPFARFEYWNDPDKTAAAWRGDAFSVGDLGRVDDDGYLYIEGRREDLIISGGVNVYPAEVERVLIEHPDVAEAAVFGVDDDEFGQRVCAAVTGTIDADAVRAFARARLPGSHAPKQVFVVNQLPRTNTGKVRRTELRALAG